MRKTSGEILESGKVAGVAVDALMLVTLGFEMGQEASERVAAVDAKESVPQARRVFCFPKAGDKFRIVKESSSILSHGQKVGTIGEYAGMSSWYCNNDWLPTIGFKTVDLGTYTILLDDVELVQ